MNARLLSGFVILLILPFAYSSRPDAAEINGAYFEESLTAGNTALKLTGDGLLRYWGFKGYVGAFYPSTKSNISVRRG